MRMNRWCGEMKGGKVRSRGRILEAGESESKEKGLSKESGYGLWQIKNETTVRVKTVQMNFHTH